jgi:predicted transcriptional regulator
MAESAGDGLSRRERQIMDILYRRGQATVTEVLADMPDPPSDSAARALIRILEEKGHVIREETAPRRFLFRPARPRQTAGRAALKRVHRTFFDDSAEKAVVTLLDVSNTKLSPEALEQVVRLIEQARRKGS